MKRSFPHFMRAALLLAFLVVLAGSIRSEARPRAPRAAAPPAAAVTILHSFDSTSATDGSFPVNGLTLGPDGSLYGITGDGAYPSIAFRIAPDGTYRVLHHFISQRDGTGFYYAKLLLVGNQLFGICALGGGGDLV